MAGEAGVGQGIGEASVIPDAAVAAGGHAGPGGVLTVDVPEPLQRQTFFIGPQQFIKLRFDPEETQVRRSEDDLILAFDNDSEIVFRNFISTAETCPTLYVILLDGSLLPGDLIVGRLGELDQQPEPDVGTEPSPGVGEPAAPELHVEAPPALPPQPAEAPPPDPEPDRPIDIPAAETQAPAAWRADGAEPVAQSMPAPESYREAHQEANVEAGGDLLHVAVANLEDDQGRAVAAFEVAPDPAGLPVDTVDEPVPEPSFVVVEESAAPEPAGPEWPDSKPAPQPTAPSESPDPDSGFEHTVENPWPQSALLAANGAASEGAAAVRPEPDPVPLPAAEDRADDNYSAVLAHEEPLDLGTPLPEPADPAPVIWADGESLAGNRTVDATEEPDFADGAPAALEAQPEAGGQTDDPKPDAAPEPPPAAPEPHEAPVAVGPFWVDDSVPSAVNLRASEAEHAEMPAHDGPGSEAPAQPAAASIEQAAPPAANGTEDPAAAELVHDPVNGSWESAEGLATAPAHDLGGTVVDDPPFTFAETGEEADYGNRGMSGDPREAEPRQPARQSRPVVDAVLLEALSEGEGSAGTGGGAAFMFRLYFDGAQMTAEGDRMVPAFETADKLLFADVTDKSGEDALKLEDLAHHVTVWDDGPGGDVILAFDGGGTLTIPGIGTGALNDFGDLIAGGYRLEVA